METVNVKKTTLQDPKESLDKWLKPQPKYIKEIKCYSESALEEGYELKIPEPPSETVAQLIRVNDGSVMATLTILEKYTDEQKRTQIKSFTDIVESLLFQNESQLFC